MYLLSLTVFIRVYKLSRVLTDCARLHASNSVLGLGFWVLASNRQGTMAIAPMYDTYEAMPVGRESLGAGTGTALHV